MYFYTGAPREVGAAAAVECGLGGTEGHRVQWHSVAITPARASGELA
jgi:hypothetical protein